MSGLAFCLCAAWCGTCRGYEAVLASACATTGWQPHWVDVEAHEDLVDAVDVENFPTLVLVDAGGTPRFAGVVTPHEATAVRLMQTVDAGGLHPVTDRAWCDVVQQLLTHQDQLRPKPG